MRMLWTLASIALIGASANAATIPGLFNTGTDANNVALAGGNGVIDPHYLIASSTSPGSSPKTSSGP